MKSVPYLCLICLALLAPQPALSKVDLCEIARAEENRRQTEYVEYMCEAEESLRSGRYQRAYAGFTAALQETLVEIPNYVATLGMAEASCRLNEVERATVLLNDFDCMLDVEIGRRKCPAPMDRRSPQNSGSRLTVECQVRMCSELYHGYYANPTEQTIYLVAKFRADVERVKALCTRQGSE